MRIPAYRVLVSLEREDPTGKVIPYPAESEYGPKLAGEYLTVWKAGDLQKKLLEIAAIINND